MNAPKCPVCGRVMTRYGHSASGAQRWRCSLCNISQVSRINSTAKHLDEFVAWLLGRRRQADMPGGGRSFRRRCEPLWQLWPFSPIIDEVHDVIFVDGIHLGPNAVVLIAQTPDCVLGWYAARSENSRAWGALMSRIAPPALVVTDGGSGFAKACKRIWPTTRVQRCTFHAYCRIRQATTTRPKLEASRSLYALGHQLTHVQDIDGAQEWIGAYQAWCTRWKGFLEEKTRRACQFFCVWGLEVGGDSVGVGGGELGEGLFPVGGGVSLDEACVSCSFVGGFASVCEALGGSFVFDVADGEP